MRLLRTQVGAVLCAAFVICASLARQTLAEDDKLPSVWSGQAIKVDGQISDWPENSGLFLSEQKATIAASNDSKYLYLQFRTRDLRWIRAIQSTGLTFYVDPNGGKKKDFFIRFTGGPNREQMRALMAADPEFNRRERPDRQRDRRDMPPDSRRMDMMDDAAQDTVPVFTCFVKDQIVEKHIPLDGAEGPAVAFDTSLGFFVYEFRVPITGSEVRNYGVTAPLGKEISVGVFWGEKTRDGEQQRPSYGMGDDMPMGGRPGGGMGGGMGGRPGGMRPGGSQRPEKQEIWLKTKLASDANSASE